jgi:hypothetical protein
MITDNIVKRILLAAAMLVVAFEYRASAVDLGTQKTNSDCVTAAKGYCAGNCEAMELDCKTGSIQTEWDGKSLACTLLDYQCS